VFLPLAKAVNQLSINVAGPRGKRNEILAHLSEHNMDVDTLSVDKLTHSLLEILRKKLPKLRVQQGGEPASTQQL
jgi:hypothetical protein